MTPKEKAEQLVNKYLTLINFDFKSIGWKSPISEEYNQKAKKDAIQCALFTVDEIMKAPNENSYLDLIPEDAESTEWFWSKFDEFWNEVKEEIIKL